jgi:threonine dehydrogenase-like Zn-dependent dehydrogenase
MLAKGVMSMAEQVRAATLLDGGKFEIREYAMPEIGADDALLKVEAAGVCGSDWGSYRKTLSGEDKRTPRIMGHENTGVIAKIGPVASAKWGVKEGDRVVLEQYLPCGTCEWCRLGDYRFCDDTDRMPGKDILRYGASPVRVRPLIGGFGQYMYMHPRSVVHKLADHVTPSEAALLVPMANGMQWGYMQGELGPGKTVLIQGPGQMGLGCVVAAKRAGVDRIIVTGVLPRDKKRFEMAKRLGADDVLDVSGGDAIEQVRRIVGKQGVDSIVNVSGGAKGTVDEALQLAGKRGIVVLAGAGDQEVRLAGFGRKVVQLRVAHGSSYQAFKLALETIASKAFPLAEMCTHQFPMARAEEAILALGGRGPADVIHVNVLPWG